MGYGRNLCSAQLETTKKQPKLHWNRTMHKSCLPTDNKGICSNQYSQLCSSDSNYGCGIKKLAKLCSYISQTYISIVINVFCVNIVNVIRCGVHFLTCWRCLQIFFYKYS